MTQISGTIVSALKIIALGLTVGVSSYVQTSIFDTELEQLSIDPSLIETKLKPIKEVKKLPYDLLAESNTKQKIELEKKAQIDFTTENDVKKTSYTFVATNKITPKKTNVVVLDKKKYIQDSAPVSMSSNQKKKELVNSNDIKLQNRIRELTKIIFKDKSRGPAPVAYHPRKISNTDKEEGYYQNKMSAKNKNSNSKTIVKVNEINLFGLVKPVNGFDLKFLDSSNDFITDNGDGVVEIETSLNVHMANRYASINSKNIIQTSTSLIVERGQFQSQIPAINSEAIAYLQERHGLKSLDSNGLILVELSPDTEDVEISGSSYKKLYLDHNYRVVNPGDSEYSNILLINIKPGNIAITYRTIKNEYLTKIVHVSSNELFFDANYYTKFEKRHIDLKQYNLLSRVDYELNLSSTSLKLLSTNESPVKRKFGQYEFKTRKALMAHREYIYIEKYLNNIENFIVGTNIDEDTISIPSNEVVNKTLIEFKQRDLAEQCLVQVDLPKNKILQNINVYGQSDGLGMYTDQKYLDKDGNFYNELGPESTKLFIRAEGQGIVSIRIDYESSAEYLSTPCTNNAYIVEQL